MPTIGSFGTVKESFDFDYFGTKIRVNPRLGHLTLVKMASLGSSITDESTPEQVVDALRAVIGCVVHPDDFDTMWDLAEANGQDIADLTDLMQQVVAAVTDRPTERPSSSSAGQPRTKRKSAAGSSLRVQRELEKKGRPDLALVVLQAREDRKRRSA
jgi:hypothetical protein